MTPLAARHDQPENLFAVPAIVAERRADGSIILKSTEPLQPGVRCVGDWLEQWASQTPDAIFLGERASVDAPWTTVTYQHARRQVRSLAAWILAQRLSADCPLVILSDNSVDHALFALAAQHVGVPSAAISPAYSLMSRDFDKLRSMVTLLNPGAIYVSGSKPFAAALAAIKPLHSAKLVSGSADDADAISFRSIVATPETPDVGSAFAAITPDTIAKFLFTSGSTGTYRTRLRAGLADLNKDASGAWQRVTRAIIMRRPPSFDSGEITEKGSLNARLIRERRADLVEALYSGSHPDVIKAG